MAPTRLEDAAPAVPSGAGNLPALDGVRGAAALMVVLTHVGFQTGETVAGAHGAFLARMDLGVAVFFALSGFLLHRPWARAARGLGRRPGTRRYLRRRAVRILPAYWLALAAVLLTDDVSAGDGARHATLTQIYGGHLLEDFTQTWSLATEVSFYLVLPALAALLARSGGMGRQLAVLACLAAVAPVWAALFAGGHLPGLSNTWLPGHLDWFASGMALAVLLADAEARPDAWPARVARDLARHPVTVLAAALAVTWFATTSAAGPRTLAVAGAGESVVKELSYAVVATLVVAAAAVAAPGTSTTRVLGGRVAAFLGRVSYGVFLWHLLVLDGVFAVLQVDRFTGSFLPVAVVTVAGSVAVAALSWTLLEQPLLDRFSRPVSARRSLPAPAG